MTEKKTELKKLSDIKYTGDKKTFTEKLTKEQIKDLLDGYKEVTFGGVKIGFHIRYFKKQGTELDFRMGGTVIKKEKNYLIVSNGKANWSVQEKGTVFFQQIPLSVLRKELEDEYEKKITEKDDKINELMSLIKELTKKNKMLENKINKK